MTNDKNIVNRALAAEKLPIVSICCITYNHAPFISKALDGFLMQEPPTGLSADEPWYEILIHDDASTDGTTEIIKEYAAKYPDKIFPLYEKENQYSKGKAKEIDLYNYNRARGKYIAYCEGDDYWTIPDKLKYQIDFMESHSNYSVCWHRCQNYHIDRDLLIDDKCAFLFHGSETGIDISLSTYFSNWSTQPLTMLFRRSMFDLRWSDMYKYYRDQHEMYHLLKNGKGYMFAFMGGVHVHHGGGIYSSLPSKIREIISLYVSRELYKKNKDKYTKKYYENTLQWLIYANTNTWFFKCKYSVELFLVNYNFKKLIKNVLR